MTPNNGSIKAEARRNWRRAILQDANINGWATLPGLDLIDGFARTYQDQGKRAAYQEIKQFNHRDALAIYLGLLVYLEFGLERYQAGRFEHLDLDVYPGVVRKTG